MKPSLAMVSHIAKDSSDFRNRLDKYCSNITTLTTCFIKSLGTNIRHDLSYKAVEYCIEKSENDLPQLRRFNKQFILEDLLTNLEFNYFYITGIYVHQIKQTAMENKFDVVGSNLVVAYEEIKILALLLQFIPIRLRLLFLLNDFRFLHDVFINGWRTLILNIFIT